MAYATVDEFEDFLDGDATPAHPERLLELASEDVDHALVGCVYDVGADGNPTDTDIAGKLSRITVLQAYYVATMGDDTGAKGLLTSLSTGGVSWSREPGTVMPLGPRAARYFQISGLGSLIGIRTR